MDDTTSFASWLTDKGVPEVYNIEDDSPDSVAFQTIPRNPLSLNHSVMMKKLMQYDFWLVSSSPGDATASAVKRFIVVGGASPTRPDPFVEE